MEPATAHRVAHSVGEPPKIGLILGAGGVLGGAWLAGTLHAIASETGWDAGEALITSLGLRPDRWSGRSSLVGCRLVHSRALEGRDLRRPDGRAEASPPPPPTGGPSATAPVDRRWGARTRIVAARAGIAGPPTEVLADAADRRLAPARNRLDRTAQGPRSPRCRAGWSPHPNFWAVAVDYATGRQVAFGRPAGSPPAHLPDAVAASSAVPGFYRTVTINGRSYIDDGVHSTSNLDVLRNERLDVVLALNPMASLPLPSPRTVAERLAFAMRKQAGRRIERRGQPAARRRHRSHLYSADGARPGRDG